MRVHFQKNPLVATLALLGGLFLTGSSWADAGSIAGSPVQPRDDSFWTLERIREAIPVYRCNEDRTACLVQQVGSSAGTGVSSPVQPRDDSFWTPERIREAIPVYRCNEDRTACTVTTDAVPPEGGAVGSTAWVSEQPAGAMPRRTNTWGADPVPETEARDDLSQEWLLPWFEYEVLSATSIRISFRAGTPVCFGQRAVLVETPETVGIAVVQGVLPGAPQACPALLQEASFVLHTAQPLQGRAIVALDEVPLRQ